MDIRTKLKLSDISKFHVNWFREGQRLRLYQGALCWAEQQGLPIELECRELKSLNGERLLFAEFDEAFLLIWLRAQGLVTEPQAWGWRVALLQPRCQLSEQAWLEAHRQQIPTRRWRSCQEKQPPLDLQLRELLEEVREWPVNELPAMQALKAIRRWKARVQQLLPAE